MYLHGKSLNLKSPLHIRVYASVGLNYDPVTVRIVKNFSSIFLFFINNSEILRGMQRCYEAGVHNGGGMRVYQCYCTTQLK
jgi:hypothetical protein